jgi:hypothetical protein
MFNVMSFFTDPDYTGTVKMVLKNLGGEDLVLRQDAAYVQLVPTYHFDGFVCSNVRPATEELNFFDDDPEIDKELEKYVLEEEASLEWRTRGDKGFGSTGSTSASEMEQEAGIPAR